MLPDYLMSSYKQYKEDTDSIASWLATTARNCGYPADLLSNVGGAQKTPRLKGKARKLAKQNLEHAKSGQPSPRAEYVIALKDFLALAQHIAAYNKPPVTVPSWMGTILERTIDLRKNVAYHIRLISSGTLAERKDSEAKHSYFVGVLEEVYEQLKPRMASNIEGPESKDEKPSEETPQERLSNLFSVLEVYDPREGLDEPQRDIVEDKASSAEQTPVYRSETPDTLHEAFTAFASLLNDFNRIRDFVIDTWLGFKEGQWDVVSASITSNTALELARGLENEAANIFQDYGGSEDMLNMLYLTRYLANKHEISEDDGTPEALSPENLHIEGMITESKDSYELAKSCFMPAMSMLDGFRDLYDPSMLDLYKPGHYGVYDPRADRESMTPKQKFNEDKVLLGEVLSSFRILAMAKVPQAGEDELVRGFIQMLKTKKIPLSLGLSAQLYLDVHHHLREQIEQPFQDLIRMGNAIFNTVEENMKFHTDLKIDNWPKRNDQGFHNLKDYITKDIMGDPIKQTVELHSPVLARDVEKHYLLRHYPMRCGLCVYYVKVLFNDAAVTFANAWGSIMSCAHLYNALQQEKLLEARWRDIELVLAMQDTNRLFAGDLPTSAGDYVKRFSLAIGASAANFARSRRQNHTRITASSKGPRSLRRGAEVNLMFSRRYVDGDIRADMSVKDVEIILEKAKGLAKEDRDDDGPLVLEKKDDTNAPTKLKKVPGQNKRPSIQQALMNLRVAIHVELPELSFDYLLLHRMCWRLLRMIKQRTQPQMTEIYGTGYLESENQLPFLVGYIFMTMSSEQNVEGLVLRRPGFQSPSRILLEQAAESVNEMFTSSVDATCAPSEIVLEFMKIVYGFDYEFEEE